MIKNQSFFFQFLIFTINVGKGTGFQIEKLGIRFHFLLGGIFEVLAIVWLFVQGSLIFGAVVMPKVGVKLLLKSS